MIYFVVNLAYLLEGVVIWVTQVVLEFGNFGYDFSGVSGDV